MTKAEIVAIMEPLEKVFDIVRLVDVTLMSQFSLDHCGGVEKSSYHCYAVWKKGGRCENCVSSKALACQGTRSKFEFVDNMIYYVLSKFVEVDGRPYVLEMVSVVSDETLVGAYGKDQFMKAISTYNEKIYMDSLTGAYNRRYYDEQLQYLPGGVALAILDLDNFKEVNDTFGHLAGDEALRAVVEAVKRNIRDTDAVVRYGGDEFLVILREAPRHILDDKLERIRAEVSALVLEDYPQLHLSVSIGGLWSENGLSQEILEKADELLYQAKKKKNTVVLD